jgi:hypothetical protein
LACSCTNFATQRGTHIGVGQHVVQRFAQAFEEQIEFTLRVRQRGGETENVVVERAENQAVPIGRRGDSPGQSQRSVEAGFAVLPIRRSLRPTLTNRLLSGSSPR